MESTFITALKNKVRFPYRGQISTEDLWDLQVGSLDQIYKTLIKEKKNTEEESLLTEATKEDSLLDLQISIVKYIVAEKLEEKRVRESAAAKRLENQKIMEIIESKKDASLYDLTIEELEAKLRA